MLESIKNGALGRASKLQHQLADNLEGYDFWHTHRNIYAVLTLIIDMQMALFFRKQLDDKTNNSFYE